MTQIDFYQIESSEAPLLFTCRLIDKIYHQGRRVHIHTESVAQSEELDDLLWSFRPERFIPHSICQEQDEGLVLTEPVSAPEGSHTESENDDIIVKISHEIEPLAHRDTLVNLSGAVPDFFSRFERVLEVVPLAEASRISARENYKFYKDRGYQLKYHAIKSKTGRG